MKFLILSDIHGSSYYFHKVLEFYKLFKCDKMLILGDLLYHGPRNNLPYGHDVKQLVELLNSFKDNIICVKGNCDAEVDEMVLDFPLYKEFKLHDNNRDIYLLHGHKLNFEELLPFKKNSLVLFGHTHIHDFFISKGVYYFNPGSLSLPKNKQKNSFAILDDDVIFLYDIEGNIIEKYNLLEVNI